METVIKTTGLTKRYGAKIAVNEMNMTVNRGDIYGFIGRNGSGKTTAMKIILGLTKPNFGTVELFGGENLSDARKKIGSLIEAPGIYKNCSAFENMKRFAILSGGSDEDIKNLLELVGLGNTGSKSAGQFSLGMKQRLGIAVAMLGDPEVMILDEPVNGLDPEGIKDVRDCILKLNREKGVTFLISSHLLDELAKIVTKYGIINNGVLVEEIEAQELAKRCESGVRITVDDVEKAKEIILNSGIEAEKIKTADNSVLLGIESDRNAEINAALVKGGVGVTGIKVLHGNLEKYFIDRIGK
mgnify:CR=1 FL=1